MEVQIKADEFAATNEKPQLSSLSPHYHCYHGLYVQSPIKRFFWMHFRALPACYRFFGVDLSPKHGNTENICGESRLNQNSDLRQLVQIISAFAFEQCKFVFGRDQTWARRCLSLTQCWSFRIGQVIRLQKEEFFLNMSFSINVWDKDCKSSPQFVLTKNKPHRPSS